jgi:DNA-binding NarL/FixJ family response regulator
MTIRVMLADDQTLIRQGIRSLLELSAKVTVVGEASDGSEILSRLAACKPDVLLLDIRMPVMTGIEALRAMQAQNRMVPTIILTTFDDEDLLLQGMEAGARGYLLKDVSLDILISAIEQVHAGGSYVQPVVTERILKGRPDLKLDLVDRGVPEVLTEKELEVLRLMAGGYSNREISLAICRSEGTVKNLVSVVLGKLGARDRTRAVLRAINLGLFGRQD